jgi:TonB family protein
VAEGSRGGEGGAAMRFAARGSAPLVALALALVAAEAGAVCVPLPVLQAIGQAHGARIVRLGPCPEERPARHSDKPGQFMGCPRLENVEMPGATAAKLVKVFSQRGSITCADVSGVPDWSDGESGVVGIEFDSDPGPVRVLLRLPGGLIEVGFASGVRYPVRGSDEAATRWRAFVAAFSAERHATPGEFVRDLLADQAPPRRKEGPPVPLHIRTPEPLPPVAAADDSTCRAGDLGEWPELPEVLSRVEPDVPPDSLGGSRGVETTVLVEALVCRDGRVHDVKIRKSVPPFDAAAIDAVRQWVFKPARSNGRPIAVWVAIPIKFAAH